MTLQRILFEINVYIESFVMNTLVIYSLTNCNIFNYCIIVMAENQMENRRLAEAIRSSAVYTLIIQNSIYFKYLFTIKVDFVCGLVSLTKVNLDSLKCDTLNVVYNIQML